MRFVKCLRLKSFICWFEIQTRLPSRLSLSTMTTMLVLEGELAAVALYSRNSFCDKTKWALSSPNEGSYLINQTIRALYDGSTGLEKFFAIVLSMKMSFGIGSYPLFRFQSDVHHIHHVRIKKALRSALYFSRLCECETMDRCLAT